MKIRTLIFHKLANTAIDNICKKIKVLCRVGLFVYLANLLFPYGPGSSVGIATDYGLDGPGSNPGGDEIFRPSRPALGPTQPPVQWVPGIFSEDKVRPGRAADHSPPSSAAVMEE